jgi:hypothetical protein
MGDESQHATPIVTEPTVAEPPTRPNKLARILATVIVSSVMAAIVTKLLGRKTGFVALVMTATAHEVVEGPLARVIGEQFNMMTS